MDRSTLLYGLIWLAVANLGAWTAFAVDKAAAQEGGRRIRERTLLMFALLGGSPAAVAAQQALRHKTRKEPFRTQLFLIVLAQVIVLPLAVGWLTGWIG